MKIVISGATGLIGRSLRHHLETAGHAVTVLSRRAPQGAPGMVYWNPQRGILDPAQLEGYDAIIHLAGENIAAGLWTPAQKAKIRDSRVLGTQLLAEAICSLNAPPSVFVSSSAIGFYGSRGDAELIETSSPGTGFLSDVCVAWEAAANPVAAKGIRVVKARTGIVMSTEGSALQKMLPAFWLGAGSPLGPGTQYMSWIDREDEVSALYHTVMNDSISGPVNLVAPNPVTNRTFTYTLAKVLRRPVLAPPVPAFVLKLMLGEMAEDLLLGSAKVLPQKLLDTGFHFRYPTLESCLTHQLSK